MTLQSGKNVQVALKRQAGLGTPASGASAIGLNINPGQGLKLNKAIINSNAIRKDGQTKRGRHGSRNGDCAYGVELGVGMMDDIIEAAMRGTWVASASILPADVTSITTTTNSIVGASGSFLTKGLRRGDLIKAHGSLDAGNNGKWLRVVSVTASVITVAGVAPLGQCDAGHDVHDHRREDADERHGTPVERYYTIEEFGQDIAKGLLGTDFKVCKLELSIQPDEHRADRDVQGARRRRAGHDRELHQPGLLDVAAAGDGRRHDPHQRRRLLGAHRASRSRGTWAARRRRRCRRPARTSTCRTHASRDRSPRCAPT
jgi:hypothetical protein